MDQLNFRISSALKNIIGKELITNKYVAIFELVKNAYDASAGKVEVIFEDDKIIVKDNGKGMSLEDIRNKWLFVGYSAKADNSENEEYANYRNKIQARKSFAGAKGVGRFACDRLGTKLKLVTLKDAPEAKIESIQVFWDDFEMDSKKEFMDIKVQHEPLVSCEYFKGDSGLALEITGLREDWTQDDIDNLKRHLSRLINPNDDKEDNFEVYISFNGDAEKIENFIFEKLGIKTTRIHVEISKDGKTITTELIDRGERIYHLIEANQWSQNLYGINFTLFYLNKVAKTEFTKNMGVRPSEFGSISLYKNGFRVFPFGEPGEDLLGLDKRKTQGYARFLGTRDLIGKIEINNNNIDFRETSSRDGGLIETKAYKDLRDAFIEDCLKRFEAYVVDALDWTFRDEDKETGAEAQVFLPQDRENEIYELLGRLTKSKGYISLEYGYKFKERLEEQAHKGYSGATEQLRHEAKRTGNRNLEKAVKAVEASFERKTEENEKLEKDNDKLQKQAVSLMSLTSSEFDNLVSYHHQISICTDTINNYLDLSFQKIEKGDFVKIEDYLQKIKKENSRIASIAGFATKTGMKEKATKTEKDLVRFIQDYINDNGILISGGNIAFQITGDTDKSFLFHFRPFDISVIIDNLIKNAKTAKASSIYIAIHRISDQILEIVFRDNGHGFKETIQDLESIFEKKFSTTDGSGWGLFHVRQILNDLNSTITAKRGDVGGANFVINFLK